ncbi:MAG: Lrp/AsnC ligand binding domain-containing protein [Chloroflexota bacterium]
MKISAYVFVECSQDPAEVARGLSKVEGVVSAHALFGPMDLIAYIEAEDLASLDDVIARMYSIPGLKSTDTRIIRRPG